MKYALVTGASRGIGRAVALRLANEYPVIINYHSNSESANEVKAVHLVCSIEIIGFARSRFIGDVLTSQFFDST